jgi:NADH-quinone oxidoreductase subunit F
VKWGFIKPDEKKPVYLICNADESEPGTFKDRYIIHEDPHQLIEGMLISCFALNARTAYIYIRGEFPEGAAILERAIEEARAQNFLGKDISAPASIARSTSIAAPALTSAAKRRD